MTGIYALRDRLIDYFLKPFPGPDDKDVMHSVANAINNPENYNAVAQAPHHFEIWKLCTIDEKGQASGQPSFLADCSTLIRAGRPTAATRPTAVPETLGGSRRAVDRALDEGRPQERPIAHQAPERHRQGAAADSSTTRTADLSNN